MCPCTKCAHMHVVFTPSLFPISLFCFRSLSRYEKVPQERYSLSQGWLRVYYSLDLLLSKLSKAQSNGKFRERNSSAYCSVARTIPWRLLFLGAYYSGAPPIPWRLLFRGTYCSKAPLTKYRCRQNIADDKILTLTKYRRRYFVGVNILSPSIFCRQRYFVSVDILSTAIFCRQR